MRHLSNSNTATGDSSEQGDMPGNGMNSERDLEQVISANIESTLERLLAPIAQVERLKRKEYLTPEEVEILYGLKATTLANMRCKGHGPEYIKVGDKVLYRQQAVRSYLEARAIRTRG